MSNPLSDYARHSPITDPGPYAALLDGLPDDLPGLHQCVQNVLIHNWKVRKYHREWLAGRTNEYARRTVARMLEGILQHHDAPLTVERPEVERLITDCRHAATLLCAMLRARGTPARVRCGFATYLEEGHYQDHWVCEYWDGARWMMEDPDLMKHDVPPEQFYTGGRAWQMARAGAMSADRFGYAPDERGLWIIRQDLVRDLASLNRMEMLSSDCWGLIEVDNPTDDQTALLDEAAVHTLAGNEGYNAMRDFYEHTPGFKVPPTVTLYNYVANTGAEQVSALD
jgi:hypothetical protein